MITGLFWQITVPKFLTGNVLLEGPNGGYLNAIDDGSLALSPPVTDFVDPPEPTEIFCIVRVSENRIAFKSGELTCLLRGYVLCVMI